MRAQAAPPPPALFNGDIQIYKWVWWRNRPWKIISSFIINERNSSQALCPLQTQFSNEKCCAFVFITHLSSAHPFVLWGIHSFKCWSQGPALRIKFQTQSTIFRIKEWGGEGHFSCDSILGPDLQPLAFPTLCSICSAGANGQLWKP